MIEHNIVCSLTIEHYLRGFGGTSVPNQSGVILRRDFRFFENR